MSSGAEAADWTEDSQSAAIKPDVKLQQHRNRKKRRQQQDRAAAPETETTVKMHVCGCLLFSGLVSVILLHCSDGFRVQPPQHLDRTVSTSSQLHPREAKERKVLRVKLLRSDDQVKIENDVMEPKRKRSFPGNNAPLDRLSVSSMETKQAANKQSKVVELPRQRVKPPPIDRIGINRLPNSRG